jgi:hypothetical protein
VPHPVQLTSALARWYYPRKLLPPAPPTLRQWLGWAGCDPCICPAAYSGHMAGSKSSGSDRKEARAVDYVKTGQEIDAVLKTMPPTQSQDGGSYCSSCRLWSPFALCRSTTNNVG